MLFTKVALAVAALAGSTFAADEFYLKTTGSNVTAHNDLYVEGYHTGAGQAVAVLSSDTTNAGHFYLNNTALLMDIGDADYTYGFEMLDAAPYAFWQIAAINIQTVESGFSFNSDSFLTWNGTEFAGWLACDWWHESPQLFWIVELDNLFYPSTCSVVNLTSEAISS